MAGSGSVDAISSRAQDLFLDSSIRNWVLIPITIVMVLVGVLRSDVLHLLQTPPKRGQLHQIREQRILVRSQALQANLFYIPPQSFLSRRQALIDALSSGTYLASSAEQKKDDDTPKNPLEGANMEGMMGMLKNQMVMMVPQTVIMGWINFFFNGFVLTKLPFPLTLRFKPMMQRGIDTPDMDVAWVSSLSWYFLNLFGLTAVYRLVLGDEAAQAEGARDMASMGNMAAGGMPGMPGQAGPDPAKVQQNEKDNLSISAAPTLTALGAMARAPSLGEPRPRAWAGDGIEDRVLTLYADEY